MAESDSSSEFEFPLSKEARMEEARQSILYRNQFIRVDPSHGSKQDSSLESESSDFESSLPEQPQQPQQLLEQQRDLFERRLTHIDPSDGSNREGNLEPSESEWSLPDLPQLQSDLQRDEFGDPTHLDPPTPGDALMDLDLDDAVKEEATHHESSLHSAMPVPKFQRLVDYPSDSDEDDNRDQSYNTVASSVSLRGDPSGNGERSNALQKPITSTQTVAAADSQLSSSSSPPLSECAATNSHQANAQVPKLQHRYNLPSFATTSDSSTSDSSSAPSSQGSLISENVQMDRKRPRASSPPSTLSQATKRVRPTGPFLEDSSDDESVKPFIPGRKLDLKRLAESIAKRSQNATISDSQTTAQPDRPLLGIAGQPTTAAKNGIQSHDVAQSSSQSGEEPRRKGNGAFNPSQPKTQVKKSLGEVKLGTERKEEKDAKGYTEFPNPHKKEVVLKKRGMVEDGKQSLEKATPSLAQHLQNPVRSLGHNTTNTIATNNGPILTTQSAFVPDPRLAKKNVGIEIQKAPVNPSQETKNLSRTGEIKDAAKPDLPRGQALHRPAPEKSKAPIPQPQPKDFETAAKPNKPEPSVRKTPGKNSAVRTSKTSKTTSGVFPSITLGTLKADNESMQASRMKEQDASRAEAQIHNGHKSTEERTSSAGKRPIKQEGLTKEKEPMAKEARRASAASKPAPAIPTPPSSQNVSHTPAQVLASPKPSRPDPRRVESIEAGALKKSQESSKAAKPSEASKAVKQSETSKAVKSSEASKASSSSASKTAHSEEIEVKIEPGLEEPDWSSTKVRAEKASEAPRSRPGVKPSSASKAVEPPKTNEALVSGTPKVHANKQKSTAPPTPQTEAGPSKGATSGNEVKQTIRPPRLADATPLTAAPSTKQEVTEASTTTQNTATQKTATQNTAMPDTAAQTTGAATMLVATRPSAGNPPSTPAQVSPPPTIFAYTIWERLFSETDQSTSTNPATQIVSRAYTDLDHANAQAERRIDATLHHPTFYTIQFQDWQKTRDENDCVTFLATFTNLQDRGKKHYHKIWVARSAEPQTPTDAVIPRTPFINKTLYILRLAKVLEADDEDEDAPPALEFQSLATPEMRARGLFSELMTVLGDANRAARRLQIALSHMKNPGTEAEKIWQENDDRRLREKMHALDSGVGGKAGLWESEFNGLGGERFRLVVEEVGVSGPRNV
ncbi:hypothetical protein K491DRAFT_677375 [Lophiostoma macrostomum CBS 122681]|uniref:Uncharacterized protein n=1 Tax=Lophiostoma macrostomum CBS 122681 TaxID=1314788 RepID=A0A6A6TC30_9PLEO|nr:hypothetical protein K491DRAFT_677375 [Lophiostoma macrostomum CBS 122681]